MNRLQARSAQNGRAAVVVLVLFILIIAALLAGAWVFRARLESQPPEITLSPSSDMVGLVPIQVDVTDKGSGLKSVTVTFSQGGTEQTLASEQYPAAIANKKIEVSLAKVSGIKEGPAVLRVNAHDASLWHWGKGNDAVLEKNVTLDVTPPQVELIADDRYINFGGVGAIVYRSSPDTAKSGVKVGAHFFPGFQNVVKGHPDYYFALFAHAYDVPPTERATIVATDKAGNTREMRLSYELKNVKYKKSTIAVSDNFFQNKVVPLLTDVSKRGASVRDVFIAVDKGVRKLNEDKITEVTSKTTPKILWDGAFAQLSNSKVEANFADARTYTYNGEPIDTAFHLGYDLSVTKHYPIEAANAGIVAFTGDLGLYGNAVIIDHGLGVFTLYGHMSQIDVKMGDAVKKRGIIGRTGETGFAGGDHLHFGVYLDGVAVLPVEWWDQKWIDDNITPKLEGHSGDEIAEAQRPTHKAGHKRRR
ncbi:MAG TPA: M23 family metallopeptidase [Usitatibacter sp.]|jgi:murein DD-endopeptidase MepM/ murein hydrolase activator NlpD|nr:M23 family metallopeptidase [Usitatibacter sp.]